MADDTINVETEQLSQSQQQDTSKTENGQEMNDDNQLENNDNQDPEQNDIDQNDNDQNDDNQNVDEQNEESIEQDDNIDENTENVDKQEMVNDDGDDINNQDTNSKDIEVEQSMEQEMDEAIENNDDNQLDVDGDGDDNYEEDSELKQETTEELNAIDQSKAELSQDAENNDTNDNNEDDQNNEDHDNEDHSNDADLDNGNIVDDDNIDKNDQQQSLEDQTQKEIANNIENKNDNSDEIANQNEIEAENLENNDETQDNETQENENRENEIENEENDNKEIFEDNTNKEMDINNEDLEIPDENQVENEDEIDAYNNDQELRAVQFEASIHDHDMDDKPDIDDQPEVNDQDEERISEIKPERKQSKSLNDLSMIEDNDNQDNGKIDENTDGMTFTSTDINQEYNLNDVPDVNDVQFKQQYDDEIPRYDDDIEPEEEILKTTSLESKTKEIGIQTIILAPEIKLGSKTKKRIAMELGYFTAHRASRNNESKHGNNSSLSPIMAAKQMRSSSQKIAKIINEHKAQLKVMFDRYSNGLTNKIKLDGLTRMLKDRNILKKLSLVPEITKAFHKSSFTKDTPDSLTFDEFLQCIIRLANDLLSRKKKSKYQTAESRVSLFLAKLHLRPFPKEEELNSLSDVVSANNNQNNKDPNRKSIAADLSPKNMARNHDPNSIQMQFDYRLTEKQLDSEFDNYFSTGGFFSDAASSSTTTRSTPNTANTAPDIIQQQHHTTKVTQQHKNNNNGPMSPSFKNQHQTIQRKRNSNKRRQERSQSGHTMSPNKYVRALPPNRAPSGRGVGDIAGMKAHSTTSSNKRVKPSPLQKQQRPQRKTRRSYQEMYNNPSQLNNNGLMSPQQIPQQQQMMNMNMNNNIHQSPMRGNNINNNNNQNMMNMYSPQIMQQQQMMSPQSMYNQQQQQQQYQDYGITQQSQQQPPQHYNDYYDQQYAQQQQQQHINNGYPVEYARQERELTDQIQHLTAQEQQIVNSIRQKQQNQLRAVQGRHRSNSYGQRR